MAMHYWDDNVVSNPVIGLISPASEEDRVQNAWSEICRVYFPNIANAAGERYQIAIQPYRGIGIPSLSRPDIIVVRFSPGPSLRSLDFTERDLFEIECKRPSEDTPSGWRDAIQEETDRLAWYSTEKSVFFGIAIGKKVIFFMWDHTRNGSEFHIKTNHGRDQNDFDKRAIPLHAFHHGTREIRRDEALVIDNPNDQGVIEGVLLAFRATALAGENL